MKRILSLILSIAMLTACMTGLTVGAEATTEEENVSLHHEEVFDVDAANTTLEVTYGATGSATDAGAGTKTITVPEGWMYTLIPNPTGYDYPSTSTYSLINTVKGYDYLSLNSQDFHYVKPVDVTPGKKYHITTSGYNSSRGTAKETRAVLHYWLAHKNEDGTYTEINEYLAENNLAQLEVTHAQDTCNFNLDSPVQTTWPGHTSVAYRADLSLDVQITDPNVNTIFVGLGGGTGAGCNSAYRVSYDGFKMYEISSTSTGSFSVDGFTTVTNASWKDDAGTAYNHTLDVPNGWGWKARVSDAQGADTAAKRIVFDNNADRPIVKLYGHDVYLTQMVDIMPGYSYTLSADVYFENVDDIPIGSELKVWFYHKNADGSYLPVNEYLQNLYVSNIVPITEMSRTVDSTAEANNGYIKDRTTPVQVGNASGYKATISLPFSANDTAINAVMLGIAGNNGATANYSFFEGFKLVKGEAVECRTHAEPVYKSPAFTADGYTTVTERWGSTRSSADADAVEHTFHVPTGWDWRFSLGNTSGSVSEEAARRRATMISTADGAYMRILGNEVTITKLVDITAGDYTIVSNGSPYYSNSDQTRQSLSYWLYHKDENGTYTEINDYLESIGEEPLATPSAIATFSGFASVLPMVGSWAGKANALRNTLSLNVSITNPHVNAIMVGLGGGAKCSTHNNYSVYYDGFAINKVAEEPKVVHYVDTVGQTTFSALELSDKEGIYAISGWKSYSSGATFVPTQTGTQYVALPKQAFSIGDTTYGASTDRSCYWDIDVPKGGEGWYDLWFNAGAATNMSCAETATRNSGGLNIVVDDVAVDCYYGKAALSASNIPAILPETDKTGIYLTEGRHTIGINSPGGQTYIQMVNLAPKDMTKMPVNTISEDSNVTRISALDYSDRSADSMIYKTPIRYLAGYNGLTTPWGMFFTGAKPKYLTYTVNVPEGKEGWYTPSIGFAPWNFTDSRYHTLFVFNINVDGSEESLEIKATADGTCRVVDDGTGTKINLTNRYLTDKNIYLSAGTHKITVSTDNSTMYLQYIELKKGNSEDISVMHKIDGLADSHSFSALETSYQGGIHTVEGYNGAADGEQFVVLPSEAVAFDENAEWDEELYAAGGIRKAFWDLDVMIGDKGWYEVSFNAAYPAATTGGRYTITLDNSPVDAIDISAAATTPGTALPETEKALIYIGDGKHILGLEGIGADLHIQQINIAVKDEFTYAKLNKTGVARVMATDFKAKSERLLIDKASVKGLDGANSASSPEAMYIGGDNAEESYLTYTVDVADDASGWYSVGLGIAPNDITDASTYGEIKWNVAVQDGQITPVEVSATPDGTYRTVDGVNLANKYMADGTVFMTSGRHTIRVYTKDGNASGSYLQYIEFEHAGDKKAPAELSAATLDSNDSLYLNALDYEGIFGGLNPIDWRGSGTATALHFAEASLSFYGFTHKINVSADAAGLYNVGVKAAQPGTDIERQAILFTIDGIEYGQVLPVILTEEVVEPTIAWARSVYLTEGVHEIVISSKAQYPIYVEGVLIQKAESAYSDVPQNVTYTRTVTEHGMAQGDITITYPVDTTDITGYHMYWGDENGRLEGMTAFAYQPNSYPDATEVVYKIREGLKIPEGATRILVYAVKNVQGSPVESVNYAAVDIDTDTILPLSDKEKLYSFWVMSDNHFGYDPGSWSSYQAFEDMVETDSDAIGVFSTGDITNDGYLSNWLEAKRVYDSTLGEYDMPFYIASGNHDVGIQANVPETKFQYYDKYAKLLSNGKLDNGGKPYYYFKQNGDYFIILNDEWIGTQYGPTSEQLDWLEGVLEQSDAEDANVFIFNHYGVSTTNAEMGNINYSGNTAEGVALNARYQEMLSSRRKIFTFFGHKHFPHSRYSSGTFAATIIDGIEGVNQFNTNSVYDIYGNKEEPTDGTSKAYVSVHNDYAEGYYVEVYEDYVVVRGRSFSSHEWESFATFMIKTGDTYVEATCADDSVTVQNVTDGSEAFTTIVSVYSGDVFVEAITVEADELPASGKKTVTLPQVENRKVKVLVWDSLESAKPLQTAIEY